MLGNLTLFAQQMMEFEQEVPDAAALAGVLFVVGVVVVISLAILIVILFLLYGCYARIPERHRQMEPWQVWLLLIPLFNLVWNFFVYPKLGKSYQSYFAEQGRTDVGDCGEQVGLWYAICSALACIPCVNYIAGPAALVLLIIFLVKVLSLKGQIPVGAA
jgi:hypothetical protein